MPLIIKIRNTESILICSSSSVQWVISFAVQYNVLILIYNSVGKFFIYFLMYLDYFKITNFEGFLS